MSALVCALLPVQSTPAQQPPAPPRQDQPEILRVQTELVQTDVMVFDRQGRFVSDLKPEDFELSIDGKPRQVEFFERVTAGSPSEETQLAAARGASRKGAANSTGPVPLDRGRPVFFYIDDLHLDPSSVYRTRNLLTKFVDQEMGQNDEAAITSASGQIGFLQQLTDNKTVLRAALAKLVFRNYSIKDSDQPAMTEYQAWRLDNYDRDITDYFVDETMRNNPGITRESALSMVMNRAHALLAQAGRITSDSLAGLEGLVRSAKSIPGRKLVFFISDGFFLDGRNSDANYKLQRITSAAAKSGVVIYSIDARGLVASLSDASSPSQFDPSGRLQRASMGELSASQDGLNALARDTGGKAYFNSNALEPAVKRALKETSTYYLLAWKPNQETKESRKFHRIEVKVPGKPGLTVQVRRGFFGVEPAPAANKTRRNTKQVPVASAPRIELSKVMNQPFPEREIPIALSLNYLNVPEKGSMLSASMQVPREFFSFAPVNGKETAVVELGGTVFNAKGQAGAKFSDRITITAVTPETKGQDLAYGHPIFLGPGLYHVRVAARDEKSGRAGSAHGWIEIPDLSKGQLTLSSVLLGTRPSMLSEAAQNRQDALASIGLSVDNRFPSGDYLRFLVLVYNAARASADAKPDVAIQLQIVRDDQPVVTTPLKKVSVEELTDLGRIPYAAEVSLAGLPSGRYLLRLTAVDRVNKTSASQQTRFEIQ
ncbi:MAG: VWA domain-containing protein [Pyrinomonadaceae bacterium]|nr:VWA domain-containing protein [Pyrinomonadaceae bacterium]